MSGPSTPNDVPPITAFVSWAHQPPSSNWSDLGRWQQDVVQLATRLCGFGIDTELDLFHQHDDDVNWSTFGPQAIEDREYTLVVTSEAYRARWEGSNDPKVGPGAAREANVLKARFDRNQAEFTRRVKVLLLPGIKVDNIPAELQSAVQHYRISSFDLEGLEPLVRTLTGQQVYVKPEPGIVPKLPPHFLAEVSAANEAAVGGARADASSAGGRDDVTELRLRLEHTERALGDIKQGYERLRGLVSERATLLGALEVLGEGVPQRASSPPLIMSTPPLGVGPLRQCARLTHEGRVLKVVFSPDGKLLATASADGTARLWDTTSGRLHACLKHRESVTNVRFSPDGQLLATASRDGTARLLDVATGVEQASFVSDESEEHLRVVSDAVFSPDKRRLVIVRPIVTTYVLDIASGGKPLPLPLPTHVFGVAFCPEGRLLAAASLNKVVWVWDFANGNELSASPLPHNEGVTKVVFSPGGSLLAAVTKDRTVTVWEVMSGRKEARLVHDGDVNDVVFGPDGGVLATAGGNEAAKLWETASGRELASLPHEATVFGVAFSPDGRLVATASADGSAGIWATHSGNEQDRVYHDDDNDKNNAVTGVAFSPDGRLLATASSDHTARLWNFDNE